MIWWTSSKWTSPAFKNLKIGETKKMKREEIEIRETKADDLDAIMEVEKLAFGQDEEANLVSDLLKDKTAEPRLSLLAFKGDKPIGHILFTRVYFDNSEHQPLMHILAPLAVIPEYQGKGIGGNLIREGLEILKTRGTELVFVLGHEKFYPRFGFIPDAGKSGFIAPYPIPDIHADAWMFQCLNAASPDGVRRRIKCADELNKPEYWEE